ncbi:MAG: HDIG domain-containing protein [bacterium]|nr:HDIG domain-containing protein [bacterium]
MTALHKKRLAELSTLLSKNANFSFIKRLYQTFPQAQVYLVGGAIRDTLLDRETKDYDFLVRNVSTNKLEKFLKPLGKVNLVGRKFGVLKFVPTSTKETERFEPFDIALPREEYTIDNTGHYRDFEIKTDPALGVDVDLARRDFTINALAWEVKTKTLYDPYGGYDDLCKKIIRAVGQADRRFAEDYSRMLRAIRFACSINFEIEQHTSRALKKNASHLDDVLTATKKISAKHKAEEIRAVPFETITKELLGAFQQNPVQAFDLYDYYSLTGVLLPELLAMKQCPQPKNWHAEGDVWQHTHLSLEVLQSTAFKKECNTPPDIELILATLFHDIGKPYTLKTPKKHGVDRIRFDGHDRVGSEMTRKICERLRISSSHQFPVDIDHVVWLVHHHLLLLNSVIEEMNNTTIEKYFFKDPEMGQKLLMLCYADAKGCKRKDGGSTLTAYNAMKKRLKKFQKTAHATRTLPAPILNGNEVMKILKLSEGKKVGDVLLLLREEQLSGKIRTKADAQKFIRTQKKFLTV